MPKQTARTETRSRRRTKRQSKPPKFLRVLMMAVFIAVGLYCVKAVVVKITKPYVFSYGESKDIKEISKQIAAERAVQQQLKRDIAYMNTPQGKEAESRRLGWVKPGEVALVVQQPQKSAFELDAAESMKETIWQSGAKMLIGIFAKTR